MKLNSLLLHLALVLPLPALATSVPMYNFSGGTATSGQSSTYGFRFTPTVEIAVDSLGYYDFGADGLAAGHRVGIWDITGTLLASATVNTSNSILQGPVVNGGQFRYTAIADLGLTRGQTYVFGAAIERASDRWFSAVTNLSPSSLVDVASPGVYVSRNFVFPGSSNTGRYAVGSFTAREVIASTPVPEPTSITLIGLGLLGVAASRKSTRK